MTERGTTAVAGVVLAAGRSTRMGRSKALLEVDGGTFLGTCIRTLAAGGCAPVVAVVPPGADAEAREAADAGAHVVDGAGAGSEQIDSLRRGIDRLEGATAAVVLPVDHPLVRSDTVRALVEAAHADPDAVVRPVLRGQPGHPTLFPRSAFDALRDPALRRGARSVVESARTVDIAVEDEGVRADIDTPEAYRRYVRPGP
jgi:molybdenum cofactor cytidylyltransferase